MGKLKAMSIDTNIQVEYLSAEECEKLRTSVIVELKSAHDELLKLQASIEVHKRQFFNEQSLQLKSEIEALKARYNTPELMVYEEAIRHEEDKIAELMNRHEDFAKTQHERDLSRLINQMEETRAYKKFHKACEIKYDNIVKRVTDNVKKQFVAIHKIDSAINDEIHRVKASLEKLLQQIDERRQLLTKDAASILNSRLPQQKDHSTNVKRNTR